MFGGGGGSVIPLTTRKDTKKETADTVSSGGLMRINCRVEKSLLRINSYKCEFQ